MDNQAILSQLNLYAKLCELHNENPYKYRAFATSAFNLKKIKDNFFDLSDDDLLKVPGVGKSVVLAIRELEAIGSFAALNEMLDQTPNGVVQMLKIKGLGPKKVGVIWSEMQIESVADLLNACRENRLVSVKGFGLKTQQEIIRSIEFSFTAQGKFHYARVLPWATDFRDEFKKVFNTELAEYSGEFRRCCPIVSELLLITTADFNEVYEYLLSEYEEVETTDENLSLVLQDQIKLQILCTDSFSFNRVLFETSANSKHLDLCGFTQENSIFFSSEEDFYQSQHLPYIVPEQREGLDELEYNKVDQNFIEYGQLKGILHNHTTYSDGLNTLLEMAEFAKSQHYQYLGICDHSKSAGYANGLQIDRLIRQIEEIDEINQKLAPFKVFKGIESDILGDGSLDYPDEVLKQLDFVVASVHSNLTMNKERATERLIKAIENPYTTILGHPTGRLLLMREGYPLDFEKVIDACASNGVIIELNAHPYRLDIDWTWIQYAQNKGVMISINPDAHEKQGFHDMYFGTLAARKGGLLTENCFNAHDLEWVDSYFNKRKPK